MDPTIRGAWIGAGAAIAAVVLGWALGLLTPNSSSELADAILTAVQQAVKSERPKTPAYKPDEGWEPVPPENVTLNTPEERYRDRSAHYMASDYVQLAHVLAPSEREGQDFEIFIYLVRHKPHDLYKASFKDVKSAEFFLGSYWGNEIFEAARVGDTLGIRVAAYGPFLATCKLTFSDGRTRMIYRYIDFEMGEALRGSPVPTPPQADLTRQPVKLP